MLYLNPPFYFINGVTLYPDHEDPLQFYFLPAAPHFTVQQDAAGTFPQFQLLKYRGQSLSGGFLNFDCDLGLTPDALDALSRDLQHQAHLSDPPRLSPVPIVDGTVRLILLDAQTPVPTPPTPGVPTPPAPPPTFVSRILQSARPSLYGDNAATFSVQLTPAGVTLMEQAMNGVMSPIGVVYELSYLALRPAYNITLKMDWDRIQKHMDEHFGVDAVFASVDIDKAVDDLKEQQAIVFQADTFVPEGEDDAGVIKNRDQAEAEVRDMITNTFFQPSLDPVRETKDGWDKAEHLARVLAAGPAAGGGMFSYRHVDMTRHDQKSLNVRFSERTAVRRTICPQGHLSGFLRLLKDSGVKVSDLVKEVDLNDPFFQTRTVNVISRADFAADNLQSVSVQLRYGNQPRDVLLDPQHPQQSVQWPSLLTSGAMQWEVQASYRVQFDLTAQPDRPPSLSSVPQTLTREAFEVAPRELYDVMTVPVIALDFPWDRYPHVEVRLRYRDAANHLAQDESLMLDIDHKEASWRVLLLDRAARTFSHQLVYRAADSRDIQTPWQDEPGERLTIRNPYPDRRTLTVVPVVKWDVIDEVFVDLSYEDPPGTMLAQTSLTFSATDAAPKSFSVDLKHPERRAVSYEVTFVTKGGDVIEVPRSVTLEPRTFLRSDMKGHRVITVRPPDFQQVRPPATGVDVALHYLDDQGGLEVRGSASFTAGSPPSTFEFDYLDAGRAGYSYTPTWHFANGMTQTLGETRVDIADLTIPLPH